MKRNSDAAKKVAMMYGKQKSRQSGFSLLEILVAFSILAIALGILLNIFSSGMQTAVIAEEYSSAVQIAESLMAKAGVESPLQEGHASGIINDKYRWQVTVAPFQLTIDNIDTNTIPASLFMVTVNVNWGDDGTRAGNARELELATLKLTRKSL